MINAAVQKKGKKILLETGFEIILLSNETFWTIYGLEILYISHIILPTLVFKVWDCSNDMTHPISRGNVQTFHRSEWQTFLFISRMKTSLIIPVKFKVHLMHSPLMEENIIQPSLIQPSLKWLIDVPKSVNSLVCP